MPGLYKHGRQWDKFGFIHRDGHVMRKSMGGIGRRILASARPSLQMQQAGGVVHALRNARHGMCGIEQPRLQFWGILLVGARRGWETHGVRVLGHMPFLWSGSFVIGGTPDQSSMGGRVEPPCRLP